MYKGKRYLAIIPARSGSKGLKDKNIKLLKDKPLIAYTIEAAIKSGVFDDVLVSTDSEEYADIAIKHGASVPFLRSEDLATDEATTTDVIIETIRKLQEMSKEYDAFMILQPTSPLRDENDIRASISLFNEKDANSIVSMCECEHNPIFTKELDKEKKLDGFLSDLGAVRRQDFRQKYRLNGAIYLSKVDYYLEYRDFYRDKSYAYIMDKKKSVDIDDIYDFLYAEVVIASKRT